MSRCVEHDRWANQLTGNESPEEVSLYFDHLEHCPFHSALEDQTDNRLKSLVRCGKLVDVGAADERMPAPRIETSPPRLSIQTRGTELCQCDGLEPGRPFAITQGSMIEVWDINSPGAKQLLGAIFVGQNHEKHNVALPLASGMAIVMSFVPAPGDYLVCIPRVVGPDKQKVENRRFPRSTLRWAVPLGVAAGVVLTLILPDQMSRTNEKNAGPSSAIRSATDPIPESPTTAEKPTTRLKSSATHRTPTPVTRTRGQAPSQNVVALKMVKSIFLDDSHEETSATLVAALRGLTALDQQPFTFVDSDVASDAHLTLTPLAGHKFLAELVSGKVLLWKHVFTIDESPNGAQVAASSLRLALIAAVQSSAN